MDYSYLERLKPGPYLNSKLRRRRIIIKSIILAISLIAIMILIIHNP